MSATIKDVAKLANVSQSTVSLVINNHGRVSEETRRRVHKVIEEIGYHPRRSAIGLASKTSGNIGFIIADRYFHRAESFYNRTFLGAEFEARNTDYYILLTSIGEKFDPRRDMPRFLKERNVDGVIVAGWVDDALIEFIINRDVPLIVIDHVPKSSKKLNTVLIDNEGGSFEATQHLIELGHREIAFISGFSGHPSQQGRYLGYKQAMSEYDLLVDSSLVIRDMPDTTDSDGYEATCQLLRQGNPSALVCGNDVIAFGAFKALKENKFRIPHDVSVIGFDDIPMSAHTDPPLTTVRVFNEEIGALALRKLQQLINCRSATTGRTIADIELVVRKSTTKFRPKRLKKKILE
ncbi:MAG: LacI family transcriptional regulator [candidate division Zixibacteria bacterium]|nr:LacI family transcriptional regulator [candidate division Zixibacteria bacterium]